MKYAMTYCDSSNQPTFPFILPELPYNKESFHPYFSAETFDYHHGMHHNAYVVKLNDLLKDNKQMASLDLESLIKASYNNNQAIFNNAAQVWNHSFFWNSIAPSGGGKPLGEILAKILESFNSYDEFIKKFKDAAIAQFGSGWVWLVLNKYGNLEIFKTSNAETPITHGLFPIIACDVWEHAYYIDFRNKRPDYVSTFLSHVINWEFALLNLQKAEKDFLSTKN